MPDLQINFRPFTVVADARGTIRVEARSGVTLASTHLHPRSRGQVRLRSAAPEQRPAIHLDPLQAPQDLAAHVAGLRWMRRLLASAPLAGQVRAEISPGAGVDDDTDHLAASVRAGLSSMAHPVGTCRMGLDARAVVDPQLRVHGVQGLRVIDASVMPSLPSGNTNGPSVLIGARGAAFILAADRGAGGPAATPFRPT